MHVANNLFRAMPEHQPYGEAFANPLNRQNDARHAQLQTLTDRLNRVTDAVDVRQLSQTTEFWNRLAPHERTAEQYRRDLQQFLHANFSIVNERHPLDNAADVHTRRAASQSRIAALDDYRKYLKDVLRNLPCESFVTGEAAAHVDGNSPYNLHQDFEETFDRFVPGAIKQSIRQIDFELRNIAEPPSVTNSPKANKKESIDRVPRPETPPVATVNPPRESGITIESRTEKREAPKDKKWPTSKILGVTALGVSGVGLLALAVYLYSLSNANAKRAVQQQMQPRHAAAPHYYMQGPQQATAAPAPSLAMLGFNPASANAPQAASATAPIAPAFNPNPIYGYPA